MPDLLEQAPLLQPPLLGQPQLPLMHPLPQSLRLFLLLHAQHPPLPPLPPRLPAAPAQQAQQAQRVQRAQRQMPPARLRGPALPLVSKQVTAWTAGWHPAAAEWRVRAMAWMAAAPAAPAAPAACHWRLLLPVCWRAFLPTLPLQVCPCPALLLTRLPQLRAWRQLAWLPSRLSLQLAWAAVPGGLPVCCRRCRLPWSLAPARPPLALCRCTQEWREQGLSKRGGHV